MPQLADKHLAKTCLKGVQQHCKLLFDRYSKELIGFINGRVDSFEDAQDLTQDTFIRAYKGLKKFKWDSSFKTWLFSIAKNQCRDYYRRHHAQKRSGDEIPIGTEDGILDVGDNNPAGDIQALVEKKEMATIVNDAINQLPKRQREVMQLSQQGLSYNEIAEILKSNTDTVGTNKNAAMKTLRAILKKYKKDK